MDLYLLLAEEKYSQALENVEGTGFTSLDVAFVANHYTNPQRTEDIAKKIFKQSTTDKDFARSVIHSYERIVRNLDTVCKEREVSFYFPSTEFCPEKRLGLDFTQTYILLLAEELAKKHRVTIYTNPSPGTMHRLSPANPQFKPLESYFTDNKCKLCISSDEKAIENAEKTYLMLTEGKKTSLPLLWIRESTKEKCLKEEPGLVENIYLSLYPINNKTKLPPKRKLYSCLYAHNDSSLLQKAVEKFKEARKIHPSLTLDVYVIWKDSSDQEKFLLENPFARTRDFLDLPSSWSKYSFYFCPPESIFSWEAQAWGCFNGEEILERLSKYKNMKKEEIEHDRKQYTGITWEQAGKEIEKLWI